jgi:hypothetical protein
LTGSCQMGWVLAVAMPTTGLFSGVPPIELSKGALP